MTIIHVTVHSNSYIKTAAIKRLVRSMAAAVFYSIGNFSELSYRIKTLRGMRSYARGTKAALLRM